MSHTLEATPAIEHVDIHAHGTKSLMDGKSFAGELARAAKEAGKKAIALTDHGVMGGIPEFLVATEKEGIKGIVGCEIYTAKDHRVGKNEMAEKREEIAYALGLLDSKGKPAKKRVQEIIKLCSKRPEEGRREVEQLQGLKRFNDTMSLAFEETRSGWDMIMDYLDHESFHLVVIAKNADGVADLMELVSEGHVHGLYSDPRVSLTYIRENGLGKNLIATSACLGSHLSKMLYWGRIDDAKAFIRECQETFSVFALEKQATDNPDQGWLNDWIDRLSEEMNIMRIVTTDVHFAYKEDWKLHDLMVAAGNGKCVLDEDRYHYSKDHYIKTVDELMEEYDDVESIANTVLLADMCEVIKLPDAPMFPDVDTSGMTPEEALRAKSFNALFTYLLAHPECDYEQYTRQLQFELDTISESGYADYFIIIEDMINAAKRQGHMIGPGRGSAAGSLVCFVLNVTTVDPIKKGLLFYRFLNPERVGLPDIDVDFSYEASQAVFEYLQEKYGEDRVAQIGTYGSMAARSSIKTIGKALGFSKIDQDAFAKQVPGDPGTKLKKLDLEQLPRLKAWTVRHPEWWESCVALEGIDKSAGVHAGGVVISPKKMSRIVPLRLDSKGKRTTQYDMEWIERFLVKYDLLKLDTLDLIKYTMQSAGLLDERQDDYGNIIPAMKMEDIPTDDMDTYISVYQTGRVGGVFQVESDGMRDTLLEMRPNNLNDINAVVALYRPGPMQFIPTYIARKHGNETVQYRFPVMEEELAETYGVVVYQEQIMSLSRKIAGFSMGDADTMRKGMGKKKKEIVDKMLSAFVDGNEEMGIPGGVANGYPREQLIEITKEWESFSQYAFNKAHSICYATISVWTAWLKTHHTAHFFASLLTISADKKNTRNEPKNNAYMEELDKWGLSILGPDIRRSKSAWFGDEEAQGVRYGIASISGLSADDMPIIERIRDGVSLDQSIDNSAGYLAAFIEQMDIVVAETGMKRLNKTKMTNLIKAGAFDLGEDPMDRQHLLQIYGSLARIDVEVPDRMTKAVIFEWERKLMGRTISMRSRWELIQDDQKTQFTGVITEVNEFVSSKGNTLARGKIESMTDHISFLLFPDAWREWKDHFEIGTRWTLKGKKDRDSIISGDATPSSEEILSSKLENDKAFTQQTQQGFMDTEIVIDW